MNRKYELMNLAKKADAIGITNFDDVQTVSLGDAFDRADDLQMNFSGTYTNLHVLACQNATAIANRIAQKPGKINTNALIMTDVYGYEQPETQTSIAGTPFIWAVETGSIEMAIWLVEKGADFSIADMVKAVENNHILLLKRMLETGGNSRATYNSGNTLLHDACRKESFEMVKLLIDYGADVNALNIIKKTPYYYTHNPGIRKLLTDAGAKKPWWKW